MADPGALDYLVIAAYFVVMIAAGAWGFRRARGADDFLVAGRRLGVPMYTGTLSAVVLGGASTIGGVSLGYQYGISGLWLVAMLGLGILALAVLLSSRLARLGVYSLAEVLELRYQRASRVVGGLVVVAYDVMLAVVAAIAIGTVFEAILDVDAAVAIVLGGGIVVAYSLLGGMWSITLTDILQFGVMTVGFLLILVPLTVGEAGGLGGLYDRLPDSFSSLTAIGGDTIFTYFLLYVFGILIGQDIWQRVFTARDGRVALVGGLGAGTYCLLYAVAGALIGSGARVLYPDLASPDDAFAQVTIGVLPVGLTGLVLAAALAAVMSTASAALLAASTVTANDLWGVARPGGDQVRSTRIALLVIGVLVVAIAVALDDVVAALSVAYALLVGALFVPLLGALYWPRATAQGALAAIAASATVVVVLLAVLGWESNDPIIFGLLTSVAVYVAVSLATRPPPAEQLRAWETRIRGPVDVEDAPAAGPPPR